MPKSPEQSGMTNEQRLAFGKSRRTVVRRANQGPWVLPLKRRDPMEVLAQSNSLLRPDLVAQKKTRMAQSPFQFFRGSTAIMASDLSTTLNVGLRVQMCGNAHVLNLTSTKAAKDTESVFDLYDLSETCPGPFEWDLKRLATSFAIAAEDAGETKNNRELAVATVTRSYRESLFQFSMMTDLELAAFKVRSRLSNEGPFIDQPLAWRKAKSEEEKGLLASLPTYRESLVKSSQAVFDAYRASAIGFEAIGMGRVGSYDYVMAFFGENIEDILHLRFSDTQPSSYNSYVADAPRYKQQGQRIVGARRTLQQDGDPYLGFTTINERDYVVSQFQKPKTLVNPLELKGPLLLELAHVCGQVLAKAHAQTGDAVVISGYLGQGDKFAEAITRFAMSYAEQNNKDFEAFLDVL